MISGKFLIATIGNVTIQGVMRWGVRETADKLDGQTAVHLGFYANEPGSQLGAVDLELIQDILTGVYIIVRANTTITNLQLWRSFQDQQNGFPPAFQFPVFNIFESDNGSAIKDKFVTRCSGENYGPYVANDTPQAA